MQTLRKYRDHSGHLVAAHLLEKIGIDTEHALCTAYYSTYDTHSGPAGMRDPGNRQCPKLQFEECNISA